MTDAEVREELLRLRKQVAELSEARKQHKAEAERDEEESGTTSEHSETGEAIKKQIEELIKLLQDEVRDMPAMPTLGVFLLGVLVGRYLR